MGAVSTAAGVLEIAGRSARNAHEATSPRGADDQAELTTRRS